jgi:hypothetical protein
VAPVPAPAWFPPGVDSLPLHAMSVVESVRAWAKERRRGRASDVRRASRVMLDNAILRARTPRPKKRQGEQTHARRRILPLILLAPITLKNASRAVMDYAERAAVTM